MKEWRANFRENIYVYVDEYFSWFFLTFGVCAIPIFFTPLFADKTVAFSSILAYSFTLLGANVYLFDHLLAIKVGGGWLPKSRKEAARASMYSAVGVFVAYNLHDGFNKLINDNIFLTVGITAFLVLLLTMALVIPLINRQVEDTKQTKAVNKARESAKEIRDNTRNIRDIVEKEGIK